MKCSRCGEECKDNQAFCLKCGTPIQVVPDFNLIEAELASNIGELMDEEDKKEKQTRRKVTKFDDLDYLDDEYYVDTMPEHDIEPELTLVDIQDLENTNRINSFQVDGTDFNNTNSVPRPHKQEDDTQEEKRMLKVKVAIFGTIVAIVVVIAILLLGVLNKDSSSESFSKVYNKGYDYYTAKDYDSALTNFLAAEKLADTKNEQIKVNKSLLATYENISDTEDEQIKVLKALITLDGGEYEYYEKLIKIYDDKQMTDEITKLMESIDDVSIKSKLSEYSVSTPKFSEEEGEYDKYITVKLSSTASEIYYTTDGSEPNSNSTKYTDEIKLDKSGKTTIKAIAYNEKGMASNVATATYTINPSEIEAPTVTPEGGKYTKDTMIEVIVPDGMKCYYTYGEEATTPTEADTEYTEPIKMLRGKNILSVILISDKGVASEVTQNVYQLNVTSAVTYDDALTILKNYLETNDIATKLNDDEYVKSDGNTITFSYNCIADIDGGEYYVINATEKDTEGQTKEVIYYGVETVTSNLAMLEKDRENVGKYKFITE